MNILFLLFLPVVGIEPATSKWFHSFPTKRLIHIVLLAGWARNGHWLTSIALEFFVQFKLWSGIRAWAHVWVHVQLGSSGSHCTKWTGYQQRVRTSACARPFPSPNFIFKLTFGSLTLCQVLSVGRQRQIPLYSHRHMSLPDNSEWILEI